LGTSVIQAPTARGQRGWKEQPDGKRVGAGISPSIFGSLMRAPGSGTGEESLAKLDPRLVIA